MRTSNFKSLLNHGATLLLLTLILSVVAASVDSTENDENIALGNSTTSSIPTTTMTPRPIQASASSKTRQTPASTPKQNPSSTKSRPAVSASNSTSTPKTSTISGSSKLSPNSTRTRNRTPNLEELLAVAEPHNNDINDAAELKVPGKLHHHNSTRNKPPTIPITVNTTASNVKTTKRTNIQSTRRNPNRRKPNPARPNYSNTTRTMNMTNTTNKNSTKLSSLSSKTFPKGPTLDPPHKVEHAKMCSVGDAIIPATCFSCRCDFNGIFNEWACTKDDLCIWANHNANLAKRNNVKKGIIATISPKITKKTGNAENEQSQHLVGNRSETQRCRMGQFYQDECQYCICTINGRYQCSDLCSRIGATDNQHNNMPLYGDYSGQNSNVLSGQGWPGGASWTGNYPNYYNSPANPGGTYNSQWNLDYPYQRYFDAPQSQWTIQPIQPDILHTEKKITTAAVKSEEKKPHT